MIKVSPNDSGEALLAALRGATPGVADSMQIVSVDWPVLDEGARRVVGVRKGAQIAIRFETAQGPVSYLTALSELLEAVAQIGGIPAPRLTVENVDFLRPGAKILLE